MARTPAASLQKTSSSGQHCDNNNGGLGGNLKPKKSRPPRTTHKRWAASAANNEERSQESNNSSRPSSVVLATPESLTRDLSDLSGSYFNGNTAPRSTSQHQRIGVPAAVPQNVYPSGTDQSVTSHQRPWRQAKIMSRREPTHPQPRQDDQSVGVVRLTAAMVDKLGVADAANQNDMMSRRTLKMRPGNGNNQQCEEKRCRAPLLILLMDPGRKLYELMQLWIDIELDTVRDVLNATQKNLSESWRQDYDGVFQVRNSSLNQLIHVLNVHKYDVKPHEVWVAKPWAMAAKTTIGYAADVLQSLQSLGVLRYIGKNGDGEELSQSTRGRTRERRWFRLQAGTSNGEMDENILILSKEAQKRIFVPDGVLKHHHACQFLSFCPPFAPPKLIRVDVLAAGDSVDGSSSHQLSSNGTVSSPSAEALSTDASKQESFSATDRPATSSGTGSSARCSRPAVLLSRNKVGDSPDAKDERCLEERPQEQSQTKRQGFAKVLWRLTCPVSTTKLLSTSSSPHPMPDASETQLIDSFESSVGTMWKVWEDDSLASQSDGSESRPLLRSQKSDSSAFVVSIV